ncbi:hypothetical protein ISF_04253 [Cordyceps fumosorosea ARSEF 2679]|uniref:Uncharacterized protein n=1 Tax=Cordyceps fumosorosea (strain ARSEF 2679) TaxID=1081104 RepID=A0A167XDG7_CORFA|nr:hypothetical protein ISF_04253 [Cordyceps fumosorosea ARSEF 2679]OAA64843.1 hypothetical protein ISF_04253 [Cordyceps fumosorosea ARSEF 2679]
MASNEKKRLLVIYSEDSRKYVHGFEWSSLWPKLKELVDVFDVVEGKATPEEVIDEITNTTKAPLAGVLVMDTSLTTEKKIIKVFDAVVKYSHADGGIVIFAAVFPALAKLAELRRVNDAFGVNWDENGYDGSVKAQLNESAGVLSDYLKGQKGQMPTEYQPDTMLVVVEDPAHVLYNMDSDLKAAVAVAKVEKSLQRSLTDDFQMANTPLTTKSWCIVGQAAPNGQRREGQAAVKAGGDLTGESNGGSYVRFPQILFSDLNVDTKIAGVYEKVPRESVCERHVCVRGNLHTQSCNMRDKEKLAPSSK